MEMIIFKKVVALEEEGRMIELGWSISCISKDLLRERMVDRSQS